MRAFLIDVRGTPMYMILSDDLLRAVLYEPVTKFRAECAPGFEPTDPKTWMKMIMDDMSNIRAGFFDVMEKDIKERLGDVLTPPIVDKEIPA